MKLKEAWNEYDENSFSYRRKGFVGKNLIAQLKNKGFHEFLKFDRKHARIVLRYNI